MATADTTGWSYGPQHITLPLCKVTWKVDADSSDSLILLNKGKTREESEFCITENWSERLHCLAKLHQGPLGSKRWSSWHRDLREKIAVSRHGVSSPRSRSICECAVSVHTFTLARTEAASVSEWAHTYVQWEHAPGISDLLPYSTTSLWQHNLGPEPTKFL